MKTKRIDPLYPETASVNKSKVTANHNAIDTVDLCPVCKKPMRILDCNDIPAFVCMEHSVALPVKNS